MSYWTDEKGKQVGVFDPSAKPNIPFDWRAWLTGIGSSYASHTITVQTPLEVVTNTQALGIITVRVGVASGQTPTLKQNYSVKCHIVAADGQEDERTVYLKMTER